MKDNDTDAIFVTRDITKSDWLSSKGLPFVHYLVDFYRNTGHTLYIISAQSYFLSSMASLTIYDEDHDGEQKYCLRILKQ